MKGESNGRIKRDEEREERERKGKKGESENEKERKRENEEERGEENPIVQYPARTKALCLPLRCQ